jgi:hypothetical protein
MTPFAGRTPIVEDQVIWVFPSGERRPGRIALCAPEPDPHPDVEDDSTWACWWFMEGLRHKPQAALGSESLQPLMLALQMIGYELYSFISRGGRVLTAEAGESGSAGVLMVLRVLLRQPGDPPPADPVLAELDAELDLGRSQCTRNVTPPREPKPLRCREARRPAHASDRQRAPGVSGARVNRVERALPELSDVEVLRARAVQRLAARDLERVVDGIAGVAAPPRPDGAGDPGVVLRPSPQASQAAHPRPRHDRGPDPWPAAIRGVPCVLRRAHLPAAADLSHPAGLVAAAHNELGAVDRPRARGRADDAASRRRRTTWSVSAASAARGSGTAPWVTFHEQRWVTSGER